MIPRRLAGVLTMTLALWGALSPGTFASAADEAEGRKRFRMGQELYLQGKYLDAAHEFEAGYAAAPLPKFFYNIGNSYRRAGDLAKARRYYQQLIELLPTFEKRAEVEANIKAIDDALAALDPIAPALPQKAAAVTAPAAAAPITAPNTLRLGITPVPKAKPAPSFQDTPPEIAATASPDSESVLRKPWFWVVVGALVAGGTTALVLGMRGGSAGCGSSVCLVEARR